MTMMMTAPPPPPIDYPTKSFLSSYPSYPSADKFSSSAPDKLGAAGYKKKGSLFSKLGGGGKGGKGDLYQVPGNDASLVGSDPGWFGSQAGMGADMYKHSGSKINMSDASPPSLLETGSVDLFGGYSNEMGGGKDTDSDIAPASPSLSLFGSGGGTFGSMGTAREDDTSPSSIFSTSIPSDSFGSIGGMGQHNQTLSLTSGFGPTGRPGAKSFWAPNSKPPPPPPGAPPPAVYSSSPRRRLGSGTRRHGLG